MKKLLTISALLGSLIIFAPSQEANAASATSINAPQVRIQIGRNQRRVRRTVTQTRIVRSGFATYRETYRITYLPNGRTRTQIISRVRIGGRRNY